MNIVQIKTEMNGIKIASFQNDYLIKMKDSQSWPEFLFINDEGISLFPFHFFFLFFLYFFRYEISALIQH